MIKQPHISALQLILLAVGSALMFPYTFMPIFNTVPKNQDIWIVLILSLFYMVLIDFPILYLIIKYKGLNFNQIYELISGKIIGKIISLITVLLLLMCYFVCLMSALHFINILIMPTTPMYALLILAVIPVTYISNKGAGVLGRLSLFIVPPIIVTVMIFGLAGLDLMELDNLKPILAESKFLEINKGALLTASRYSEINIFFIFSYFLKKEAKIPKIYITALLLYGLVFLIMLLCTILALTYDVASISINPYFIFTRQVQLYESIEKLQILNIFVWFPGTLLKLSLYSFMASYILSQIFVKVSRQKFSIALGVLVIILGATPALDKTTIYKFLSSDAVFPRVIFLTTFLIPLLVVIISFIRKKFIDEEYKKLLKESAKLNKNSKNRISDAGCPTINN
jgi:spore germination protein (amino acid permease)